MGESLHSQFHAYLINFPCHGLNVGLPILYMLVKDVSNQYCEASVSSVLLN